MATLLETQSIDIEQVIELAQHEIEDIRRAIEFYNEHNSFNRLYNLAHFFQQFEGQGSKQDARQGTKKGKPRTKFNDTTKALQLLEKAAQPFVKKEHCC